MFWVVLLLPASFCAVGFMDLPTHQTSTLGSTIVAGTISINLSVYQSICQSISWYNAHRLVTCGQSQSIVAIEQLLGHGQQMTDDDPVPLRSPPRSPQTSSTKEPLDFKVSSKSVSIMGPGHFKDPSPGVPGSVMRYDELKPTKNQVERWYGGIYGGICSSEQCDFSSPQLTTFAWITHQLKQCTVCNWLRRICSSTTCHRTIGRYRTNPSTSRPMGNEIHKLFGTPMTLIFDSVSMQTQCLLKTSWKLSWGKCWRAHTYV